MQIVGDAKPTVQYRQGLSKFMTKRVRGKLKTCCQPIKAFSAAKMASSSNKAAMLLPNSSYVILLSLLLRRLRAASSSSIRIG